MVPRGRWRAPPVLVIVVTALHVRPNVAKDHSRHGVGVGSGTAAKPHEEVRQYQIAAAGVPIARHEIMDDVSASKVSSLELLTKTGDAHSTEESTSRSTEKVHLMRRDDALQANRHSTDGPGRQKLEKIQSEIDAVGQTRSVQREDNVVGSLLANTSIVADSTAESSTSKNATGAQNISADIGTSNVDEAKKISVGGALLSILLGAVITLTLLGCVFAVMWAGQKRAGNELVGSAPTHYRRSSYNSPQQPPGTASLTGTTAHSGAEDKTARPVVGDAETSPTTAEVAASHIDIVSGTVSYGGASLGSTEQHVLDDGAAAY